jgi:DNA-binding LacI/PurR family transcriptional regulator
MNPRLTTIDNPGYKLGQLATNILFRGIAGETIEGVIKLPTKLIVRDSCREK